MAKGITEATVEEIKARVDLADLVSSYGIAVKTVGVSKKACCPFHHEKTPSFHINGTKGFYHCFGCGESGDAIKFVQKMDGLTFVEAVKKLAGIVGVTIEEREDPEAGRRKRLLALLAELTQFYRRCLQQSKEGGLARDYLKSRDLNEKIQEDYLIGYAPNGIANILRWAEKYGFTADELAAAGVIKAADPARPGDRGYHRFGGRLMFSIRDKAGRVVGYSGRQLVASKNSGKYVNSPETVLFSKKRILYGFDKAAAAITKAPNREVIVCEGQIDCIRLQTSGFPNAVAGQGTAFTEEHAEMLGKVADLVTLVYDDDGAGHKASVKTARLCLARELPVRVVSLPGGDDPDSFLRTHAADEFRRMLDNAESVVAFQVRAERAKEARPDSVDAVNRVTRELLLTIAQCPGAVLRATMVDEAARLLGLPRVALEEELARLRTEPAARAPRTVREPEPPEPAVPDAAAEPEDAAAALPPSRHETALCEFLLANEYAAEAKEIDRVLGELLPPEVFEHDFTRRFVSVWRTEIAKGEDLVAPWGDGLPAGERALFDGLLTGQVKSLSCALRPSEILEDFVRTLWAARLRRLRGELPAAGDAEAIRRRMQITVDLKRLAAAKWSDVKDMVRQWLRADDRP